MWGDHLGVVDLVLNNDGGSWKVTQSTAEARLIYDAAAKKSLAGEDKAGRRASMTMTRREHCQQADR